MDKERFNVEEHTTLDGRVLDVFPISHIYIHELEKQVKKQKEVIEKIMYKIENYTTLNEPRIRKELLDILKEVE